MEIGDRFLEIFSTVLFFIAVLHVFLSDRFLKAAHKQKRGAPRSWNRFLGNSALIFGLWLVPVMVMMLVRKGAPFTASFFESIDLREPFSYFVLIAIASVRPLRNLFDALMLKVSALFGNRIFFFWAGTLMVSALLSGIFSSVAIMTLVCLYLSASFFSLKPSLSLTYLTLSLLLLSMAVGVSIFPVNASVFLLSGWRVFVALLCVFALSALLFRREFASLQKPFEKKLFKPRKIQGRELVYLLLFSLASIGRSSVYLQLLAIAIVIILHKGFYRVKGEEGQLTLYFPLLVAFFTYTLEIHAGLQKWWVLPLFERVEGAASFGFAFLLTGINEHIPMIALKETLIGASQKTRFLSVLGVLAGGGLTVIAKSANIVSKLVLGKHFPHHAISPFLQLLMVVPFALVFSLIMLLLHYLGG